MGWSGLCKLCACIDLPVFDFKTFKRYEEEIGEATEEVAKESCNKAADLERLLTIYRTCRRNPSTIVNIFP